MLVLEEIYLHVINLVLTIGTFVIGYLIFKYLDKKPIGMQTILDQAVKDLIFLHISADISSWFEYVKYVEWSYGHYISLIIGQYPTLFSNP